jgi:hypothetical protein
MGFGSKLIAVILGLLLVSGVALSWQSLRVGSVAEMGGPLLALLAGASIVPAVGLLVWWRAGAGSLGANVLLIIAALAGAASSAVGWLTIRAALAV